MEYMLKACGICVGAANISVVELCEDESAIKVSQTFSLPHEGNIFGCLEEVLTRVQAKGDAHIALTGRKIGTVVKMPWISEPEAAEKAFQFVNQEKKEFDALVSMGAELFIAYILDKQGKIKAVKTPNKCASGTGEFFLQQIRRMNLSAEEAMRLADTGKIYRLSSRCSVFCKSDCTHALNKGQGPAEILAGLCEMMAEKVLELLVNVPKKRVMLTGGVALNRRVVEFLKAEIAEVAVPSEAIYFEALGAGLWAMENKINQAQAKFRRPQSLVYTLLPALPSSLALVDFKTCLRRENYQSGEACILGLDVGSTTTKAVLLREKDNAILASVYLRTNADPVQASRNCYQSLAAQLKTKVKIRGLGVTGSGRQIAALHASSEGIVNEIIAHARAAVYFDPEVDTIFEIGGQDAKYTHLDNMVATDYAMNEACSAGTGSFLEESCKETLGIEVEEIEAYALKSENPPNFNDQCAAFIGSDVKTACYEGLQKEDIVAGLVYSICVNYNNRVKGNCLVGNKIFMQGGVCYNKAVPLAMASLLGKRIVVPPEPGLMGAFGVALEIKEKINQGLIQEKEFALSDLAAREVKSLGEFKCSGGKEKCDRGCMISRIEVSGEVHLFGGACNKYYNLRSELKFDREKLNLVKTRQEILFTKSEAQTSMPGGQTKSIGLNNSFLTHNFFPLYYHFFSTLGMRVIVSETVRETGVRQKGAAFCYPAEIAHGLFQDLREKSPDYIFLPQILEIKAKKGRHIRKEQQSTCVILQSEPYYLRSAFKGIDGQRIFTPVIDFSRGLAACEKNFLQLAKTLGFNQRFAKKAYRFACQKQENFLRESKQIGSHCLEELKNNPEKIAVVILGRAYNAFAGEANMAIPDKFASRGVMVLPFDFLAFEAESEDRHMSWATGQMILKASRLIKKHPQLFACMITNFSCGPDSFIAQNVRDIMAKKPMLILEIDSHSADAGINTRIEAFLDIVHNFRQQGDAEEKRDAYLPARCINYRKKLWVISSQKERFRINYPRVKVLIPPMGEMGPQALSAVFKSAGINALPLLPSDGISLKLGRANTTCKECLPLILTTGSLMKFLDTYPQNGEVLVYFMPATGGNCRFGQYSRFLNHLIRKKRLKNLALWTMDTQNSYIGLGVKFNTVALKAAVIHDVLYDVKNALKVLAEDKKGALQIFQEEWQKILSCFEKQGAGLEKQLEKSALTLKEIPLKIPFNQAKPVALMGEIYVRRDDFCTQALVERLGQKGFILKTAPVLEWFYYVDYLVKKGLIESKHGLSEKIEFLIKDRFQKNCEKGIKAILAESGLYHYETINIEEIIRWGKNFVSEQLTGESIVVIGSALKEIMHTVCGVINLGPFACMPTRIIESILNNHLNLKTKLQLENFPNVAIDAIEDLPFLSLEVDGNAFPPLVDAKIETFCLQAERLHQRIHLPQKGL
jgi:predicted CoA-substrate-specific enzyme activase